MRRQIVATALTSRTAAHACLPSPRLVVPSYDGQTESQGIFMTYTCSDFSMDIARCLIDAAVVEADAYADADIGAQADLAIAGIIDAGRSARAARFVSLVLESSLATDNATLADSLRLADAIAKDATLVLAPPRASFAAFIATLPGGADWSRHLTVHRG